MTDELALSQDGKALLEEIRRDTQWDPKGLTIVFISEGENQGTYVPYIWTGHNPETLQTPTRDISTVVAAAAELAAAGFLREIRRSDTSIRYELSRVVCCDVTL